MWGRVLLSPALWAQMFCVCRITRCLCQLYTLLEVNTKPKITLLRIKLGRSEASGFAVNNRQWWCCCTIGYISLVSELIGWLSGGLMSVCDLIGCASGRMRSWAWCWWVDQLICFFYWHLPYHVLFPLSSSSWGLLVMEIILFIYTHIYIHMQKYATHWYLLYANI